MNPYYDHAGITLYHGDCREAMAALPDASIDAVVTDPPYGLAFMGKRWDYDVPSVEIWQQVLRVLKPGGHLLAFAGTRTQHRMAVRIEDAGFGIRDMIAWVYGSGFPKSLDVSKAIDKAAGAERQQEWKRYTQNTMAGAFDQRPWLDEARKNGGRMIDTGTPATEAAKQWQGWGTALKPALEPITVARKPLSGTVAANVLQYGTGGINVDACRIGTDDNLNGGAYSPSVNGMSQNDIFGKYYKKPGEYQQPQGRWPANLIHDGSDEVVGLFPETDGVVGARREGGDKSIFSGGGHTQTNKQSIVGGSKDTGSAARFFYTAKADKSDRGHGNNHPTVKPVDLMRYLVRLVCPMGGIVLDPFNGSGTTAVASRAEHCRYIGAELNEDYCRITIERLAQGVLF
jgi:DNA modification methylase